MISYTDNKYAEMWDKYNIATKTNEFGDDYLITALHKEIKELFNIEPPNPEFISVNYWSEGVHFWKTGYDLNETSEEIIKPYNDKEIYICGEAYSKKQGWIEGALETTTLALNHFSHYLSGRYIFRPISQKSIKQTKTLRPLTLYFRLFSFVFLPGLF